MNVFIDIKRGRHFDYLPSTLQGKSDLRQFVRSLANDGQRLILLDIEQEIKAVAGEKKRGFFRKFSEEELEHLSFLLELRSFVLDEMALHPSDEEVKRLERVNEKLLRLTEEMNGRTRQLQQRLEKISSLADWKKPNIYVDGSLRFRYDDELPALIFPNDSYYGSDFDYMLNLLSEVTEDWRYPHEFTVDTYEPLDDGMTWADGCDLDAELKYWGCEPDEWLHMDEDEYYGSDFGYMLNLQPMLYVRKNSYDIIESASGDLLDDGTSWAEGTFLLRPEFSHISVCHALHSLCTHVNYPIPDVLRMNNFYTEITFKYERDESL